MSSKQNRRPAQRGRKPAAAARTTRPAKKAAADQAVPQSAVRDESSVTSARAGGPAGGRTAGRDGEPGASAARGASDAQQAPSGPLPARITGAAVITAAEGALLAAYGVYLMVMGLAGDPDSPKQAEILAVVFFVLAALPLVAARGLWLRRRWSRGPAMITQIMALPVAWTLINSGGALIAGGIAVGVAALAALVLLVNPTATEALGIGPRDA